MIGFLPVDKFGKILAHPNLYHPSDEEKVLIVKIKQDYQIGFDILHKQYIELNNRSILDAMDDDQKAFLSYVKPKSEDPDEKWMAQTVRPITRNKIISIAAHVTAHLIFPNIFAQNDSDEEDEEAAKVMGYIMEWLVRNSDYELTFLYAVIQMLSSPVCYLKAEFAEVMQTIKEQQANGTIVKKEVLDELMSGFLLNIVPVDEILIANAYEFNLQKQRFIGRRRFIDFSEAKSLYGNNVNFQYILPGVRNVFSVEDSRFYQMNDPENPTLVEEFTYYNRAEDLELTFVNGILMSDLNQPIRHRDYLNRPKYSFVKSGYEPIDGMRFFFYKSACSKLSSDQAVIDKLYNMLLDGTFLQAMPPLAILGDEDVNSSVMIPGSVNVFRNKPEVQSLNPNTSLVPAVNAMQIVQNSMEESSQSDMRQGIASGRNMTAFETARLEQNAIIQLGLFGRMIAALVRDLGYLMLDITINHLTTAQVEEITGGETRLKFRTFLLASSEGKNSITKRIKFLPEIMGTKMSEDQMKEKSFQLMEKEGGMESTKRIYLVNPEKFRKLHYLISVNPDELYPKTEALIKAYNLEFYDRAIANPLVDAEALTRDYLVGTFVKNDKNKYMKKQIPITEQQSNPINQLQSTVPQTNQVNRSPLINNIMQSSATTGLITR